MRLPPVVYGALQRLVQGDYAEPRRVIGQWYSRQQGEAVLELGCGTGTYCEFFPPNTYTGIDFDAARIEEAKRRHPSGSFQAQDALNLPLPFLRRFPMILCVDFFHHLSDAQANQVLGNVRAAASERPIRLLTAEPTLARFRDNPVGFLLAKADDGRHVRTLEDTKRLFGTALRSTLIGSLIWIWPVPGGYFELEFP